MNVRNAKTAEALYNNLEKALNEIGCDRSGFKLQDSLEWFLQEGEDGDERAANLIYDAIDRAIELGCYNQAAEALALAYGEAEEAILLADEGQINQDWENGITVVTYDDGSKLVVDGPSVEVLEG